VEDFVSLMDLAPTFLEAAGVKPAEGMHGRSLMRLFEGKPDRRDKVFLERERHARVREGDLSYPMRAVRTREFLYIRNLRPDRWPAGDPPAFGDIDPGPTKEVVLARRDRFFEQACAKRPAEELYDLRKDSGELDNVAAKAEYGEAKRKLRADLDAWMKNTGDPRAVSDDDRWDQYPYAAGRKGRKKK
jgi:arylsulfatase A-like enzyme